MPFKKSADKWRSIVKNPNIKLYYGLAAYKAGSKKYDKGTWMDSNNNLAKQLNYIRALGANGFMLFDYESVVSERCKEEIENYLKIIYKHFAER